MSENREPSSVRLAGTLGIAGLCSGLILVGVYLATLPRIQQNQAEAMQAAIYKVLPNASAIEPLALKGDQLVPFTGPAGAPTKERLIYLGKDARGDVVGYAVPAEGPGFQDTIKLLYGYDPSRRAVIGMEVLESRETPGLGDKIIFDPHFKANFEELKVEPKLELVKKGEKTAPNQVDAITGATISCRAVVSILNQSTQEWLPRIGDGASKTARVPGGQP
ncbi:MAG: FMN-binding protein [Polyangiaceae bacterium]|nr:FMN-binding protein [Polyangiaceae bacterium]